MEAKLAPHESFELHELLSFKNICATKSFAMSHLVKDERLKEIMNQDFSLSRKHIKELKALLIPDDSKILNRESGKTLQ